MAFFKPDPSHSGPNPPKGAIQGTLSAEAGNWEVQFRLVNGTGVFAGPTETTVGEIGSGPVTAGIRRCAEPGAPEGAQQAWLIAQYRRPGEGQFQEDAARSYNWSC